VLAEMMEEEMLVPVLSVHTSSSACERALMLVPNVRMSGFMIPWPLSKSQVVMPLLLNEATFVPLLSRLPTPTTLIMSPGLLRVP